MQDNRGQTDLCTRKARTGVYGTVYLLRFVYCTRVRYPPFNLVVAAVLLLE